MRKETKESWQRNSSLPENGGVCIIAIRHCISAMELHTPSTVPIPHFDTTGCLPPGLHDCTLEEIEARFGNFQNSDRRPRLWTQFVAFYREAKASGVIELLLIDGSFVTANSTPNDIDLVVVVFTAHDFGAELALQQYNVLAQRRVRQRFGLDIVVVKNETDNLAQAVAFFSQVRQQPVVRKGLLRLAL